ncbi:hypothetical protein ON010_g18239 [Phytophthora cinnamomi]|nr:hypothetical protein ON010_g18239 [Phytophthora cinnamomi]
MRGYSCGESDTCCCPEMVAASSAVDFRKRKFVPVGEHAHSTDRNTKKSLRPAERACAHPAYTFDARASVVGFSTRGALEVQTGIWNVD